MNIELHQKSKPKQIKFDIQGDGLHKSIVNSIRRVLLSSIPTVGFRTDDKNSDIIIKKNNTSLHNEFLSHRISLIPLYIDPNDYQKQYLFHLNVKNDNNEPITIVTAKDFQIYPLKKDVDPSMIEEIIIDNYDRENPLSDKVKKEIFQPFNFQGKDEYCMITELKTTKSSISQEFEFFGVPSVSYAYEDARWQAVSCATYSFKKDEELFQKIFKEKAELNNVLKKDIKKYEKELRISESERYFHRDRNEEPYWYEFTIDSTHFYTSKELFILAIQLIINQLELFSKDVPKISSGEDTFMQLENDPSNEAIYRLYIHGLDDTFGNLLQSHISMNMIDDKSQFSVCGYKRTHPLEEIIYFTLSLNPENSIFSVNATQKVIAIVELFQESCTQLIQKLSLIKAEADQNL